MSSRRRAIINLGSYGLGVVRMCGQNCVTVDGQVISLNVFNSFLKGLRGAC